MRLRRFTEKNCLMDKRNPKKNPLSSISLFSRPKPLNGQKSLQELIKWHSSIKLTKLNKLTTKIRSNIRKYTQHAKSFKNSFSGISSLNCQNLLSEQSKFDQRSVSIPSIRNSSKTHFVAFFNLVDKTYLVNTQYLIKYQEV